MKNLVPLRTSYFKEFETIVDAKQESRKNILKFAYDMIESQYLKYEQSVDELAEILQYKLDYTDNIDLKDALLHCYEAPTKPLDLIKKKIILLQSNEFRDKCHYCGINMVDTFDHYLPKSLFPEYSVMPINLFPCCAQCNRKKG